MNGNDKILWKQIENTTTKNGYCQWQFNGCKYRLFLQIRQSISKRNSIEKQRFVSCISRIVFFFFFNSLFVFISSRQKKTVPHETMRRTKHKKFTWILFIDKKIKNCSYLATCTTIPYHLHYSWWLRESSLESNVNKLLLLFKYENTHTQSICIFCNTKM